MHANQHQKGSIDMSKSKVPTGGGGRAFVDLVAILVAVLVIGPIVIVCTTPADAQMLPVSLAVTNLREQATIELPAGNYEFTEGDSLLLTNCVAYAGSTTNTARDNLTYVEVDVTIGDTTWSQTYTGVVANATNGQWWCLITTVPTNPSTHYLEYSFYNTSTTVRVTDTWDKIKTRSPLRN